MSRACRTISARASHHPPSTSDSRPKGACHEKHSSTPFQCSPCLLPALSFPRMPGCSKVFSKMGAHSNLPGALRLSRGLPAPFFVSTTIPTSPNNLAPQPHFQKFVGARRAPRPASHHGIRCRLTKTLYSQAIRFHAAFWPHCHVQAAHGAWSLLALASRHRRDTQKQRRRLSEPEAPPSHHCHPKIGPAPSSRLRLDVGAVEFVAPCNGRIKPS